MEIRRVADTLLRCQASPFTHHLPPSSSSSLLTMRCRNHTTKTVRRTLTSSSRHCLKLPPGPTSAAKPAGQESSTIKEFNDLFARRSKEPRPSSASKRSFEKTMNGGASDADLLNAWSFKKGPSSESAATASAFSNMLMPSSGGALGAIYDIPSREPVVAPKASQMRLTPSTGRTVTVGGTVDAARAFTLLAQSCARNQVKRDVARQRFHERPGLKRKRLVSVRWRKRFRQGFNAAVARVQQLRKQGW